MTAYLVVGNGQTGPGNELDALRLMKSGNMAIGNLNPTARLHVDGDFRVQTGTSVNEITADNATGTYTLTDNNLLTGAAIEDYVTTNAGGLTYFIELVSTGTDAGAIWQPDASIATNVGIVLRPRGTGYIAADAPNATATGGNARGNYAVDLQMDRNNATDVASGDYATISGGQENTASAIRATVGGGQNNTASGTRSTIGGGADNNASGDYSSVGGGEINTSSGSRSTVGGGHSNNATGFRSTVAGGFNNTANGPASTVGGGNGNVANAVYSTVGGGVDNITDGHYSSIPGGYSLNAPSYGEVALGYFNTPGPSNSTSVKNTADRLLVVGNGVSGVPEDALRLMKSGNMAIGNLNPTARLHVDGDMRHWVAPTGTISSTNITAQGNSRHVYTHR